MKPSFTTVRDLPAAPAAPEPLVVAYGLRKAGPLFKLVKYAIRGDRVVNAETETEDLKEIQSDKIFGYLMKTPL